MSTLAALSPGRSAPITALRLEAAEASWLRAVGLFEGVEVTVLRLAPLGGPLHLRTSSGAELAIERSLAAAVEVQAP
jgi:Fe2+ transport system protein FeoA